MDKIKAIMKGAISLLWQSINVVAFCCFVSMITLMLVQVFTRYVIKHPIPWTEEMSRFTYIWAIFLGAVIVQKSRGHMVVTAITDSLSQRTKAILESVADIFSFIVLALVFSGALIMMKRTYGIFASTIPMSYTYVYLSLAIGSVSMLVLFLGDIGKMFRKIRAAQAKK